MHFKYLDEDVWIHLQVYIFDFSQCSYIFPRVPRETAVEKK